MATLEQQRAFINMVAPVIQDEAKKNGYKICSAVIAQACVESAYGTSSLAYKYHNYFGLKCGSKWSGPSVNMKTKEEYQPGTLTAIRDNFRAYPDLASGVHGYYQFISASRYKALKSATSAQYYLQKIKAAGYCTSSTYVSTCMSVVNKHSLYGWDDGNTVVEWNPYARPYGLVKRGMRGEPVQWLQWELVHKGYDLKIDGIYGPKTEDAVRNFQSRSKLICDAVVGPRTIAALIC